MNFQKKFYIAVGVLVVLASNNCGRFNGADQWNPTSSTQSNSTSNMPNENLPSSPQPQPQAQQPNPQPMSSEVNTGGAWGNQPAGLVNIVDCPLSKDFCGAENVYNTFPFVSMSSPLSSPWVFDSAMEANSGHGNGQFVWNFPLKREVYMGTYWSTNADFEGTLNNTNKMIFISQPGEDNSFLVWQGQPNKPKTIKWYTQGLVNNTHLANTFGMTYPTDGTGWFNPNTADAARATVSAGSGWHKLEVYLKSSTTRSSRDGIVRWWVDGYLVGDFSGVNISAGGFNNVQYNAAWDDSSNYVCPGVRDCSKAWHHYYDHLYVSVR